MAQQVTVTLDNGQKLEFTKGKTNLGINNLAVRVIDPNPTGDPDDNGIAVMTQDDMRMVYETVMHFVD